MALQTCQKGNVASRSMPSRDEHNGFDRSIFGKKCYKGAGRFREFGNLQCRKGVRIYRLNWKHVYVTCMDLPGK